MLKEPADVSVGLSPSRNTAAVSCAAGLWAHIPIKEKLISEKSIDTNGLTFANVRDRLFGLGTILEESFGDCYYVVNVPAGVANKNAAVVLVLWSEETLSLFAYAKEGLIHQNTAENAIKKV